MDILIVSQSPNSLRTQYVGVLLHKDAEFRQSGFVCPQGQDIEERAEQIKNSLWAKGNPATKDDWIAGQQETHRQYYKDVLLAIQEQFEAGGSLDMINGMALNVIAALPKKEVEFNDWRILTELTAAKISTIGDKRDLMALIINWCSAGMAIGDGR